MDIRPSITETLAVLNRVLNPTVHRQPSLRRLGRLTLLVTLSATAGCDRFKAALDREGPVADGGDPVWQGDSTFLAGKPAILFRVMDGEHGRVVAPIATMGAQGFRPLKLSNRGWKAFDIDYLHEGHTMQAVSDGRATTDIHLKRGMWVSGTQLDSIPQCIIGPAGVSDAPTGIDLAVVNSRPTTKPASPLSASELQEALSAIPTLIAPSSGVSTSMLPRYKRDVHVLSTGTGPKPTIVVEYNDPEQVSDTLAPIAQRPRQFIVVLDKGLYGFKPTFTFSTLGNAKSNPRMTYLDYVDVDGDGRAELFFKFITRKYYDVTIALKFEHDQWHESFREGTRCH